MGMNAINWMAKQKTGDDKSKSALFWLAFHMNDKTGECFPSISTLQAEMEVKSDNTVRSALRRLRDAGLISWERETRDGVTVKTKYRLHMHGSMTAGTSADKGTSTIAVPQPLKGGASTVEGGTSTIAGGVPQPLRTNMEIEQGINKERNREVMCAPSGNSSANAAVASAQAQTLPTSFPQSSNSENSSKPENAGRLSLSNALERSINTHGGHLDTPDGQTHQRDARCSQNASTSISGACLENEPPPMSDEDLENLFANAQLEECPPFPEKGEHPPFEKGVRLPDVSEKGDHLSTATKHRATTRRKPSTPCPFDMESSIPDEYLEIAKKAGIGDPQRVFSSFVAHAVANGRRLIVWPAGFRNWCDNELKWHPDQKPKITPQSQKTAKDYEWI